MAEEKKKSTRTKKTTTTEKKPKTETKAKTTKSKTVKEKTPKTVAETVDTRDTQISDLKKELTEKNSNIEMLKEELINKDLKINELKNDKTTEAQNHYSFIARYDNIKLDGIKLDNLKCVIYECDAETEEEAKAVFDEQLKGAMNSDLLDLKKKIFGAKMIIEKMSVLPELSETKIVELG